MKTRFLNHLMLLLATVPLALPALAQETPPKLDLQALEKQAVERVTITLDKQLLLFAARFLPSDDPDTQQVRDLVKNLDAISVRTFKFDQPKAYSDADVEKIRQQLTGPGWSRLVEVRGKDNVDIYLKKDGDKIRGFTIIAAEPRELTLVTIQGIISPEQLSQLEGFAGIPRGVLKDNHQPRPGQKPQTTPPKHKD